MGWIEGGSGVLRLRWSRVVIQEVVGILGFRSGHTGLRVSLSNREREVRNRTKDLKEDRDLVREGLVLLSDILVLSY